MFECFICSEEREKTNVWTCEQCSKDVCLYCFEQITSKQRPRCPYCRLNIGKEEDWEFPFDIPFYNDEIIPLLHIDGDIITEFIRLPSEERQDEIDQWIIELMQNPFSPILNSINSLIQEYLPELSE